MPQRVNDGHQWIGAATVSLPNTVVRMAAKRGIFKVKKDLSVSILEVYCSRCNLGYDRAAGKPCAALESRDHLIGGPVGDQRKRRGPDDLGQSRVATA